jgi:hypothetical protein
MKALIPSVEVDPVYLRNLLSGMESHILDLTEESGHGTKTLLTDKLGAFPLCIPPLDEQIIFAIFVGTLVLVLKKR